MHRGLMPRRAAAGIVTTAILLLSAYCPTLAADATSTPRATVGYVLPLARAVDDGGSERTVGWLRNNGIYTFNATRLAQGGDFVTADQLNVASSGTSGYATNAGAAATATTAGFANNSGWAAGSNWALGADTATNAANATWANASAMSNWATASGTASYAENSNRATSSARADSASRADSAAKADTADTITSGVVNSVTGFSAEANHCFRISTTGGSYSACLSGDTGY